MAFGQNSINSYILTRSSAGKSKNLKGSTGARTGDAAREGTRDGALEGYLDDAGVEATLVAADDWYIQLADEVLRWRVMTAALAAYYSVYCRLKNIIMVCSGRMKWQWPMDTGHIA